MKTTFACIVFFLFSSIHIFPQGEAAVPFLNLPTSPKMNALGAAGTASIESDPYKFYFNPAHLGYSSRSINFSSGFYPSKINYAPTITADITLNSYVFNAGYNLQKFFPDVPLSVGFGFGRNVMSFGRFIMMDSEQGFESKDEYSIYSIGIGYHSIVDVSFGFSVKDVTSKLSPPSIEEAGKGTAEFTALDYGLLVSASLNNFLNNPLSFYVGNSAAIITDANYSLGYAIQNIGDKIYYIDRSQADPIGRAARLGHSLQLAETYKDPSFELQLLKLSYSIDSEDLLIKKTYNGFSSETSYQGLLGDIRFGRNLFLGKGNPEVVLHKGFMVEFFEIFTLASGGFSGRGFFNSKTDGFGFRAKGILKLLNLAMQNSALEYIMNHFDVEYCSTKYFSGNFNETEFNGMTITVGGF